jgi:predicted DNA-binding transcriptional regulator YafY
MSQTPTATSGRLFSLLSLLQTPREWPGPELASRLHVTTRTVRNDVERLRALGYPVEATRGPIGGYRLVAGTAMPPLLLEDEEAVAVAVSLRTASGGAVSGMEESALRALTKLQQVLPKRLGQRVDALQSHTARVAPYSRGPAVDGDLLTLIANAARDRELIRFDYSDRSGAGSERKVEPYRLVNWGRRWYLVAFDPQRDDWRTFRVDRLKETRSTGHRFRLRDLPAEDVAQ